MLQSIRDRSRTVAISKIDVAGVLDTSLQVVTQNLQNIISELKIISYSLRKPSNDYFYQEWILYYLKHVRCGLVYDLPISKFEVWVNLNRFIALIKGQEKKFFFSIFTEYKEIVILGRTGRFSLLLILQVSR